MALYGPLALQCFVTIILSLLSIVELADYLGGIPVPGRSVPAARIFELYMHSCVPTEKSVVNLRQMTDILSRAEVSNVVSEAYNNLYMTVGNVDVEKIMGNWYTVIDTPRVHSEYCPVIIFELIERNMYTAAFNVRQYSRNNDEMQILEGYGRKIGPDPGNILVNTGHPADPCPYSIVNVGPLNADGLYDYLVFSQPIKYPTFVLARDYWQFENKYTNQVKEFLEKYGFLNPSNPLNNHLNFINTTNCLSSTQYKIHF